MTAETMTAEVLVTGALDYFRRALTAADPVLATLNGLDYLGKSASLSMLSAAPLTTEPDAKTLLSDLMPRLVDAVSPAVPSELIAFGMGCANAILIAERDEFHVDRLLYMALLLAALRTHLCKTELARRGDPLMRVVAARRAMVAERDPGTPCH